MRTSLPWTIRVGAPLARRDVRRYPVSDDRVLPRTSAARSAGDSDVTPLESRARWAVLAGLTLVTFLLLLDDTAVSVALPTIQRQLGVSLNGVEWVIKAYSLTLAVFTLLAGRLADRDGRRRMFLVGLGIFVLGSLASGLAPSGAVLIVTRAVQGLGAALVAPASLAIIAETFPKKGSPAVSVGGMSGWFTVGVVGRGRRG